MTAKKKKKKNMDDSPEFQKLVSDMGDIIEKAKAKGVDFSERFDLLECRACGAHEDETIDGIHEIADKDRNVLRQGRFIIIDSKEKSYHRNTWNN